jgi:hypothetical protein
MDPLSTVVLQNSTNYFILYRFTNSDGSKLDIIRPKEARSMTADIGNKLAFMTVDSGGNNIGNIITIQSMDNQDFLMYITIVDTVSSADPIMTDNTVLYLELKKFTQDDLKVLGLTVDDIKNADLKKLYCRNVDVTGDGCDGVNRINNFAKLGSILIILFLVLLGVATVVYYFWVVYKK